MDGPQDFGLRLIASAVTVLLFLSVLFLMVHRLRQRKLRGHQTRQLNDDQRSLASIGYIGGSLSYLGGVCDDATSHFPSLWKPPGNYFPRGEAPPPYDEAVAQARAEALSLGNMGGYHRSFPLSAATNMDGLLRGDRSMPPDSSAQFPGHQPPAPRLQTPFYLNNVSAVPAGHGNSIADMRDRQVVVMGSNQARNFTAQHSITSSAGNNNFISTLKITSSLSAVSNRGRSLSGLRDREQAECARTSFLLNSDSGGLITGSNTQPRPTPAPGSSIESSRQHRTIPRMLSVLGDQPLESSNFMHLKQRQSSSQPKMSNAYRTPTEDMPRHNSNNSNSRINNSLNTSMSHSQRLPANEPIVKMLLPNEEMRHKDNISARLSKENILRFVGNENVLISRNVSSNDHAKSNLEIPRSLSEMTRQTPGDAPRGDNESSRPTASDLSKRPSTGSLGRLLERHPLLPMPADTTPCGCSYDAEPMSVLGDDPDDYHSECENCKSANGSRYYLDESEEGSELCETMTLHRRPQPEHSVDDLDQLPTSLTLPVKTKRNRCPPGARDAWFSSMPGTSSSEDD